MLRGPSQRGTGCSSPGSPGIEVPPASPSPTSFLPALESPLCDGVLPALLGSHPRFPGGPKKCLDESPFAALGMWDLNGAAQASGADVT